MVQLTGGPRQGTLQASLSHCIMMHLFIKIQEPVHAALLLFHLLAMRTQLIHICGTFSCRVTVAACHARSRVPQNTELDDYSGASHRKHVTLVQYAVKQRSTALNV
jgi:hypothetical protein